jgi:hypothetical protein
MLKHCITAMPNLAIAVVLKQFPSGIENCPALPQCGIEHFGNHTPALPNIVQHYRNAELRISVSIP